MCIILEENLLDRKLFALSLFRAALCFEKLSGELLNNHMIGMYQCPCLLRVGA